MILDIIKQKITKRLDLFDNSEEFCVLNCNNWHGIHGDSTQGYALYDGLKISNLDIALIGRVANAVIEETGCMPLILVPNYYIKSSRLKKMYKSFNIENFVHYSLYRYNIISLLISLILTVKFYLSRKNPNDLLYLKFNEIFIGDLIYDSLLRSTPNLFTLDTVKLQYFKHIFGAYFRVLTYENIFKRYRIRYLHVSHLAYIQYGSLARIAQKHGATVFVANKRFIKNYKNEEIREGKTHPRKKDVAKALDNKKEIFPIVEAYLEKRFSGNIIEIEAISAFSKKKTYSKDQFKEMLGITNDYPTVFILAHIFRDEPHRSLFELSIFIDYYVWFVETLQKAAEIKNINWVIKPHPIADRYGESGEVESLVEKYREHNPNIYIAPQNFNTSSIKDIADVVISAQGTAGLEFSCFGIPVIITAKAEFSGHGFTIEPKTKDEYFNLMRNIRSIKKLNSEQKEMAKILLWCILINTKTDDILMPFNEKFLTGDKEKKWKEVLKNLTNYSKDKDPLYCRVKRMIRDQ